MKQSNDLVYAVRLPVLRKYFGQYCFVLAALVLPSVVVGIFLFTSLVMALPFMCEGLSFRDGWFESVSACTTSLPSSVLLLGWR